MPDVLLYSYVILAIENYRTRRGACHHVLSPRIPYFTATISLFYPSTSQATSFFLSTFTPDLIQAEIIKSCLRMSTARKAKRKWKRLTISGTGIEKHSIPI